MCENQTSYVDDGIIFIGRRVLNNVFVVSQRYLDNERLSDFRLPFGTA